MLDYKDKDLFLLCTDGLSDMLAPKEIAHVLKLPLTLSEKVSMLISIAKHKGGYDNVTLIIVEVIKEQS
jgi:PPM family protein phosphatase